MIQIKSHLKLEPLLEEIESLKFYLDGSGAEMVFPPEHKVIQNLPNIWLALNEIIFFREKPFLHIMVNRLQPGVDVPVHRDFLNPTPLQSRNHPTIERWHLPIACNNECYWWDEFGGQSKFEQGHWCGPVPYWNRHKVWNYGKTERINIVIDLDSEIPLGEYKD